MALHTYLRVISDFSLQRSGWIAPVKTLNARRVRFVSMGLFDKKTPTMWNFCEDFEALWEVPCLDFKMSRRKVQCKKLQL